MISRPSTARLLDETARELADTVLPAVTDPAVAVVVEQLTQIVSACSRRAAAEIHWMRAESAQLLDYAAAVADRTGDGGVAEALAAASQADGDDLRLASVSAAYSLASDAFTRAVDAAFAADDADLTARAAALVRARMEREVEIMGEFRMPGRG